MRMRKTILALALLSTALLLASGVALAATIRCPTEPGTNLCVGSPNNDKLLGTSASEIMKSKGGDDVMRAEGGSDELRGAAGSDTLYGQPGTDTLYGGRGPDRLLGDVGNDVLNGGAGPDSYEFRWQSGGEDTITDAPEPLDPASGGWRIDEVQIGYVLTEPVSVDLESSAGEPEVTYASGASTIDWSGSIIDKVRNYDPEDDTITGNPAPNYVQSLNGDDSISTGEGDDYVDVDDFDAGDRVDCGEGDDTVHFNAGDSINADCEARFEFP